MNLFEWLLIFCLLCAMLTPFLSAFVRCCQHSRHHCDQPGDWKRQQNPQGNSDFEQEDKEQSGLDR